MLVPPTTDEYALTITFVGTVRLYLDDQLLLSAVRPRDHGEVRVLSTALKLNAGQPYRLRLEYHQTKEDPTGRIQFGWRPPGGMEKALEYARQADHIILALGITPGLEGEEMKVNVEGFHGGDRTSILLPKSQRDLIDVVAALGKPFVVVLTNGSALSFDVSKPNAILEAWYYGQRGGDAVAEALFGDYNPGGRLPITFTNRKRICRPSRIMRCRAARIVTFRQAAFCLRLRLELHDVCLRSARNPLGARVSRRHV